MCDERGLGLLVSLSVRERRRTKDVAAAFFEIPLLTTDRERRRRGEEDRDLGEDDGRCGGGESGCARKGLRK
jgi:hypothetical protein